MDKQSFIEAVRAGGIVGEGGAGFPSHVKFNAEAAVVIANGCECEPLLHTDHQILKHHPDLVLAGLAALSGATVAERAVLALKRKHNDLVPMLEKKCGERGIELFLLDDFYPAGDEQILLREVTGRSVPPQGIPLNVGAVISNVGTLKDVAAAVGAGGSKTPLTG